MAEPDLFANRKHVPTILDDDEDVPKFGQAAETVKDAIVHELRDFFRKDNFTSEERAEIPTVRKYSIGFGPGTDPYETTQKISQEYPDFDERLPHVAVIALTGANNPVSVGQPFIGHTQLPPRLRTGVEPFALADVQTLKQTITVTAAVPASTYTVTVGGTPFSYTSGALDTVEDIAQGLRDALRDDLVTLFSFVHSGPVLTATATAPGLSFSFGVSVNLATATVQAASTEATSDFLVLRTTPDHRTPVEETIEFRPELFLDVTAATAAEVVRVINEQGRYVHARTVDTGSGIAVEILSGGKVGGLRTPNEVEVVATSSANAVAVLALGNSGVGAAGDAITAGPALGEYTLSVVGAAFPASFVGEFVTLGGVDPEGVNGGRHEVLAIPVDGGDDLVFAAPGAAESFATGTWFVGRRDDSTNPLRPPHNRRCMSWKLTAQVAILTESANTRTELSDLVTSRFTFWLEEKHFELLGRGIFDEAYLDEIWQISIHKEIQLSGETDVARPAGDMKDKIYISSAVIPVTLWWYLDRSVSQTLSASQLCLQEPVPLDDFQPGC